MLTGLDKHFGWKTDSWSFEHLREKIGSIAVTVETPVGFVMRLAGGHWGSLVAK
jgi:hypothetical protein